MVVIALGMACSVAQLTTAVLMSVDSNHTGAASALNSAVARTSGLVATALIAAVMSDSRLEMDPQAMPFDGKWMFWGGFKVLLAM
jgi:uncharacterized protein YbaA (DUF1428 family)